MIVLGISDSHEAHACILADGKLLAVMAEERLSRLKADMGYPHRAIDSVIEWAGIKPGDIDIVAFAGEKGSAFHRLYKLNALFSVQDWIEQCRTYWGPILIDKKNLSPFDDFERFRHLRGPEIQNDPYYPFIEQAKVSDPEKYSEIFNRIRIQALIDHLGTDARKIRFFRHEDCHACYGYHSSPFRDETPAMVFSVEGGGDDSSATVSIASGDGIREIWKSNDVQVGRLYRYITLILGMKPSQHEYKVMGLAPYGTEYHGRRSLEYFRSINRVNGGRIENTGFVPDLYFSSKDALEGERFDGIAWGLQTWVEEILSEWVENNIREHGIDTVVLTGGVAQNIKACKRISELDGVNRFWVGPVSGDGSLGVGAAWMAYQDAPNAESIAGLPSVYLGSAYSASEIAEAVCRRGLTHSFHIMPKIGPEKIAEWLDAGYIIARFDGRMEFGQRALGNRSIIADPRRWESVEKINSKIKYRDFWMPFTPSMMVEEAERLLINPKRFYSPFMTMAFDLKPQYHSVLPAVIHPSDKTIRPQMLKQEDNPGYYEILTAFKKITGFGVLLNTSFNLHGDAIVESPDDAIHTFLESELDILVLGDVAVSRVTP